MDFEESSVDISYEPTTKLFNGSFSVLTGGEDLDTWRFKARQRGPKGNTGVDGKAFLEIANQLLDDPTVRSTEAIITMRKASASDDIIFLSDVLFSEVPVSNLSAVEGDSINDVEKSKLMSAEFTLEETKNIGFFSFDPGVVDVPELNLPSWTPTKDCVQSRRWHQYRYDWFNQTDPKYLFQIIPTPKPSAQCCQESFFYCPNLGDTPCTTEGKVETPTPIPVPCDCECENPIAGLLFGEGLILDPIDLTAEESRVTTTLSESDMLNVVVENPDQLISSAATEAMGINIAESVVDGISNTFVQDISGRGNIEVRISLDYDADICGGEVAERQSRQFVDSDAIQSMFSLVGLEGIESVSNDGLIETNTIPVSVAFTVRATTDQTPDIAPVVEPGQTAIPYEADKPIPSGLGEDELFSESMRFNLGRLQLTSIVNTTQLNYCRGYRITVTARSDQVGELQSRSFIVTSDEQISEFCPPEEGETAVAIEAGPTEDLIVEPYTHMGEYTNGVPVDEVDNSSFVPISSFAADGSIVSGGGTLNELASNGLYSLEAPIVRGSQSAVGAASVIITANDVGVGKLIGAPAGVPFKQDGLNNNINLHLSNLSLNFVDASFDQDGIYGRGTYILGTNFSTMISSRSLGTLVRTDVWGDTIGFWKEPQSRNEKQTLVVIARLVSSSLFDNSDSLWAFELFNSQLSEGILVATFEEPSDDLMMSLRKGTIALFSSGNISIAYYGDDVVDIYPNIDIAPVGPAIPASSLPPGDIVNFLVEPASQEVEDFGVDFELSFETANDIPVDGKIIVDFPNGFDISNVSVSSLTIDGFFNLTIENQQLIICRSGGTRSLAGFQNLVVSFVNNTEESGVFSWNVETRTSLDVLIDGPATSDNVEFSERVLVPSLLLGGSHYPCYDPDSGEAVNFVLSEKHESNCVFDHWHAKNFLNPVISIDGGDPLFDSDPDGCGFGTKIPFSQGLIVDLGAPDPNGLLEFGFSILRHEFDEFLDGLS